MIGSSSERLRFKLRMPGRAAGWFWLIAGLVVLAFPEFPHRGVVAPIALMFGAGIWIVTRPTAVLLDASASVLQLRRPRLPFGADTLVIPMGAVAALETEVVPGGFRTDIVHVDSYRLVWRLASGERLRMRPARIDVGPYRARCDEVNAFLAASRKT